MPTALAAATIFALPIIVTPIHSLAAASSSTPAGFGWSILKTKDVGPFSNVFNATDALSPSNVWAVGCANDTNANCHTLIEHWNGKAWSVVPSPNEAGAVITELNGVSGDSPTDVWAVGDFTLPDSSGGPFVLHWNGSAWRQVATPAGTIGFLAVSAISPNDAWAVGGDVAEHWDGHTWSITPVPIIQHGTVLQGVTAISSTNVWAVGEFDDGTFTPHTIILHWNGKSWSVSSSPNTGPGGTQLFAVSAVSSNDVWAVGEDFPSNVATLTEHWNGKSWTVVPGPNVPVSQFFGVAAVSSTDVWAVGSSLVAGGPTGNMFHTLAERWNGSKWTVSTTPSAGGASGFLAVSPTSTTVFAVGDDQPLSTNRQGTLAEAHPA
ncbi:MAG: hypothetical protein ACR2JC_06620 [Chloroflexota bacterium]